MRKRLRVVSTKGLGLATIMSRELASRYGVPYVHLAVFAIDIDRVYALDPERTDLPFGWEVFLTEAHLLASIDPADVAQREMLAAICAGVLEEPPGAAPLGGQLLFAVYDAVQRGKLDPELSKLFATWRKPPQDLLRALADLWADEGAVRRIAAYCASATLEPPLAAPTREALVRLGAPAGDGSAADVP